MLIERTNIALFPVRFVAPGQKKQTVRSGYFEYSEC